MIDYDLWKTTEPPSYFMQEMKSRGIRKGTEDYEEYLKNEFVDYIATEIDNGSEAIEYVIQKFFGGWAEFRKTIANKVSGDEETFREFCDEVES